ncbi:P-loop containing nucleoside triphosphate hydrolase protein [Ochromonadaceae sp. CCMP2298]|nr:P-loop containing nucleoside triphosphate hydrolase protein [Ochromonadaceae sp. CCMP2298]
MWAPLWPRSNLDSSMFYVTLFVCSFALARGFLGPALPCGRCTRLLANPVTADGNNYRGDITEQEAFLWFDEALIHVRAGSGGPGSNTFRYGKSRQHLGPIGGSGGSGGAVILTVDPSFNTLLRFKGSASFRAENGADGGVNFANGEYGQNFYIAVPPGTTIRDNSTGEVIGELKNKNDRFVVARGGLGGQGNAATKVGKGAKPMCSPPQGGERKWIKLELNLVADIGLVGVPNAGKSTLLDAVTNARPKIASYPFTTIVPNLGVCDMSARLQSTSVAEHSGRVAKPLSEEAAGIVGQTMTIADIPGLLEGAHEGVGLGRGFLRHVERCKIIIHVVNGDSKDPVGDFNAINRELQLFSPTLAAKPQVVVLNKIDLPHVLERQAELMAGLQQSMAHSRLLPMSAAGRVGIADVVEKTWAFLKRIEADEKVGTDAPVSSEREAATRVGVDVIGAGVARIYGDAISAIVNEYTLGDAYYGSTERFDALLEAVGLVDSIRQAYAEKGDILDSDREIRVVYQPPVHEDGEKFVMLLRNNRLQVVTSESV